jgi:hypothetical protein
MEGEENLNPGHAIAGKIFAIGHIRGLMRSAEKGM